MRHFSGEFTGVRLLMLDELEAISGGEGEDTDDVPTELETITVTAEADGSDTYYVPLFWTIPPFGGSYGWDTNPETADVESIHVDVNFSRELTESEQKAVDSLNKTIQEVTHALNQIPDNAQITLSNGQTVTGAELKQIWAMTDFTINEVGHQYANGGFTSEANYNGGNPAVNVNIDLLANYNAVNGGMNFFALHELGHMTAAGRNTLNGFYADGVLTPTEHLANEQIANDIARAIANNGGMPILPATGPQAPTQGGYSPVIPIFQVPTTPPPSGGGGGGGGGGYDDGSTQLQ
ncbi:MAG: hypothetical protein ACREPE_02165 [Lysobacter sp.]